MTNHNVVISGLVGISLFALGACTSDNTAAGVNSDTKMSAQAEQKQSGYVKPGAAISFSHNYDGKTAPGEVENFQVFVKGGSITGAVDLKMENTAGLKIYSNAANQKLAATDGLNQTINVSVGAQEPGRYYLKFIASSDQGDGPMMRAYGIAIQVGDQPYVPELGKGMTAEETPSGEKIITMEATETIEN